MSQTSKESTDFALVIVESPAKAKTIEKYLGPGYVVEASVGHIRDLPKGASEIPIKFRKEEWARLGVNVNNNFEPIYVVPSEKTKQISKLKTLLKKATTLYLATDEDREGEAISWHLLQTLNPKIPVKRLVFHEITKSAILDALAHPRDIDYDLVNAQETRRVLDRLYGYEASPILWYKIRNNLSAGRVQSVAVRLIVDRERERIKFKSAVYWDILGNFRSLNEKPFSASLVSVGGQSIPNGKDFDSATGKLIKPEKFLLLDERGAYALVEKLQSSVPTVRSVEEKPYTTRPYAPFTTSALQQEANRKLNFTAKKTMSVAQSLYENGWITYMRTDSTNLSQEAIQAARRLVQTHYGDAYLPEKPRYYATKVKNAQEAHEAIRPAGSVFPLPESLSGQLSTDEYKLYDLIWKRTVASQMTDARGKRKTIVVAMDDALFHVSGKTIEFPGYLRAYVEGKDDPTAELADQETILPDLKADDILVCASLKPQEHTTAPPPRYSEASLTHMLEEKGIGRPSTYASIIDVILNRHYVFKKGGALVPTWTAFAVCNLLETHFADLVDYGFTADMEDALDDISTGALDKNKYLHSFYFGDSNATHNANGETTTSNDFPFPPTFALGLKTLIQNKKDEIDAREISRFPIGANSDETVDPPIYLRVGRYGPFVEQGDVQASVPEELPPDELTIEKAEELLNSTKAADSPIGRCPQTGKPIYVKHGRYGWYVQRGDLGEGEDKPQNASLLPGMNEKEVTLDLALALLSLPRTLGTDPGTNEPVIATNGRFGPYIKRGDDSRSIPSNLSILTITLDEALDLLSKPKYGGRTSSQKVEPLRTFGNSPVTGKEIKLMPGRFGPYVTDGETNASLPKGLSAEELTEERALELLASRAAKGASGKTKRSAKKSVAKKTTKKSTKKTSTSKSAKKTTKSRSTKKATPATSGIESSTLEPPF